MLVVIVVARHRLLLNLGMQISLFTCDCLERTLEFVIFAQENRYLGDCPRKLDRQRWSFVFIAFRLNFELILIEISAIDLLQ